jgi:hypothetical protein
MEVYMSAARPRFRQTGSPVAIEPLEGRKLLSADPLTVIVGAGAAKSVQFTDANGTQAQILLSGPGMASVDFGGTGLSQSANSRGVIVSGSGVSLSSITVNGSTGASTLQIITKGKHMLASGDILVGGSLNGLLAPGVVVSGNITTGNGVHELQLGGASGGSINIGSGRVGSIVVKVGSVSDENLNAGIPIVSLTASQWVNTPDEGMTIVAPQIGSVSIAHDFSAEVTTGSMKTISIHGSLSNSTINLTTPLTGGTNLNSLVVGGAISGTTINSGNSLGSIVAAQITDSQIYAGLVANPSAPLPTLSADFRNTSQIKSITLHRGASASFANSEIAAYIIGTANLGGVNQANGGTPFGMSAHQITSVMIVDQASGKTVHVAKPPTTNTFQSALTAKGITPADFQVIIV